MTCRRYSAGVWIVMPRNGCESQQSFVSAQDQLGSAGHRGFENSVVARIGACLDRLVGLDMKGGIPEQPERGPSLSLAHVAIELRPHQDLVQFGVGRFREDHQMVEQRPGDRATGRRVRPKDKADEDVGVGDEAVASGHREAR